jgi:hypothetical protein
MASAAKKTKVEPAPKKEAPAKDAAAPAADAPKAADTPKAADAPKADTAKTDSGEAAGAAPKNYSRGEGQKPVTQAYKDNWDAIFKKKKKR